MSPVTPPPAIAKRDFHSPPRHGRPGHDGEQAGGDEHGDGGRRLDQIDPRQFDRHQFEWLGLERLE